MFRSLLIAVLAALALCLVAVPGHACPPAVAQITVQRQTYSVPAAPAPQQLQADPNACLAQSQQLQMQQSYSQPQVQQFNVQVDPGYGYQTAQALRVRFQQQRFHYHHSTQAIILRQSVAPPVVPASQVNVQVRQGLLGRRVNVQINR